MRKQLISEAEAVPATRQHSKPCADCPWSRRSLRGWTGGITPRAWIGAAHGDERIDCHTLIGAQCAGAAVYRANVYKISRDPLIMRAEPDRINVFARPTEFAEHHGGPDADGTTPVPEPAGKASKKGAKRILKKDRRRG